MNYSIPKQVSKIQYIRPTLAKLSWNYSQFRQHDAVSVLLPKAVQVTQHIRCPNSLVTSILNYGDLLLEPQENITPQHVGVSHSLIWITVRKYENSLSHFWSRTIMKIGREPLVSVVYSWSRALGQDFRNLTILKKGENEIQSRNRCVFKFPFQHISYYLAECLQPLEKFEAA